MWCGTLSTGRPREGGTGSLEYSDTEGRKVQVDTRAGNPKGGCGAVRRKWETDQNLPCQLPITFASEKPVGKVANGNHEAAGCCNFCECELVAK